LAQTADTLRQIVGAYDARPDQGTAAGDIFRTTIDEAAIACAALLIVITDRDKKAEQKPALLLP